MADHTDHNRMATAALMDIISRGKAAQAVELRGDNAAERDRLRAEAHDLLDAYLDNMTAAARAARMIIEP